MDVIVSWRLSSLALDSIWVRPGHKAVLSALPNTILILAVTHPPITSLVLPQCPAPVMSQTTTTAQASSRFQAIFQAAVKSYQKQTKKDLIAHPLASQLKSCNSTAAIITILQVQVQEFDKSRSGDERLTKWLSPTVNVISAFSATVSGGVGLVSLDFESM